MNCKERSLLYNTYLLYKLSELKKYLEDYIISFSFVADSTNGNYELHKQKQLEMINILTKIIEEINVSKILPDYILQLKFQTSHGWTGRGIKKLSSLGA